DEKSSASNSALSLNPPALNEQTDHNSLRPAETHRQMVVRHAERKLSDVAQLDEPELSERLRGFLRVEEERLRIAQRMAAAGQQTAAARSFVHDTFVSFLFKSASQSGNSSVASRAENCAVIAVGGYGRCELAPFSDLDLLFLHMGRRSDAPTREMIERVLHLLWDAGLTIGHKVHTIEECLLAWRGDPHFQTAMVSARLITGDEELFRRLADSIETKRRKSPETLIATARGERDERAKKFGTAVYLQEPNVKESAGGLRDLHTALWAAYARSGCRTLDELRVKEHISEDERLRATQSYDFLLRVRQEAHWLAGRKTDRLALDLQPQVAERFGYTSSPHLRASEQFMRDYYRRARDLHQFSEALLARSSERAKRTFLWFKRARREQLAETFSIKDRELYLEGESSLLSENPLLFFEAVALAQTANATFSHELRDAVRHHLTALDRDFRSSSEAARAFLQLLARRGRVGQALRMMHEVGLLGRYLPEFGRISLLIQHDLYHHYTVDEHTLRAIDALDELSAGSNNHDRTGMQLRAALGEVERVELLYLSLLLHDLGKGRGRGHIARGVVIAEGVCERLGLDDESAAKVVLMVKHHVLMAHLSQRRDLSEPRLAADFAREVGSLDGLNMLLLLTYADLNAVAPGVWSDWKGLLLCELYRRARSHVGGGEGANTESDETAQIKGRVTATLGGDDARQRVERHFDLLPGRYARTVSDATVVTHLQLIESLEQSQPETLACRWHAESSGVTSLIVAVRDRRGLFADIAGALAAQGVEILSANLNTRADHFAIDNFELREAATHEPVAAHRWPRIERALHNAVNGSEDVAALVERWRTRNAPRRFKAFAARPRSAPRVVFDNEIADATTVVEIHAADEPGLAYKIASVLAAAGLDIVFARVATEKSDAFDVFYVTNSAGEKLSEADMQRLEVALIRSLAPEHAGVIDSLPQYQSEVIVE
ncbi:MAG TPA: [protein-PII] uridylyltransferase, partial [Pyrinomonadaceae bacterium]|nr:[protein-PII] uridylyltransferase [Pyrinomonadaceae bacterium]